MTSDFKKRPDEGAFSDINIDSYHITWNGILNISFRRSYSENAYLITETNLKFINRHITQTDLKSRKKFAIHLINQGFLPITYKPYTHTEKLIAEDQFITFHRRIKGQLRKILQRKKELIREARLRYSEDDLLLSFKHIIEKYGVDTTDLHDISTKLLNNMLVKQILDE